MPIIELAFNPFTGYDGINGVAIFVWMCIIGLGVYAWLESKYN